MPDYRQVQQDLTELNGDGNRERGREGESLTNAPVKELEEEQLITVFPDALLCEWEDDEYVDEMYWWTNQGC